MYVYMLRKHCISTLMASYKTSVVQSEFVMRRWPQCLARYNADQQEKGLLICSRKGLHSQDPTHCIMSLLSWVSKWAYAQMLPCPLCLNAWGATNASCCRLSSLSSGIKLIMPGPYLVQWPMTLAYLMWRLQQGSLLRIRHPIALSMEYMLLR